MLHEICVLTRQIHARSYHVERKKYSITIPILQLFQKLADKLVKQFVYDWFTF